MADNVLDKYKRSYHKNIIVDGVSSLQGVSVASMSATAVTINSATWGSALAGRTTVVSVEIAVTAPAATATSAINLTPFLLGPPSSLAIGMAVTSINPGVGFQAKTISSLAITAVSFGVAWTIFNPA